MQMSRPKIAALFAASILALSSSVYAAGNNAGKDSKHSKDGVTSSENNCAAGSSTDANANCTTDK